MKIYLAARYSRREELCGYRDHLVSLGHVITSRWLKGDHQIDDEALSATDKEAERQRFAREDWEDLMNADACISFTEAPRSSTTRGGRHVEFGAAVAAAKICLVVGPRENVFHCLPGVTVVSDWETARLLIETLESNRREWSQVPDPRDVTIDRYRELVGRLAEAKDKNHAWYLSKNWCPFWKQLGLDLKTEEQQKAFLFN